MDSLFERLVGQDTYRVGQMTFCSWIFLVWLAECFSFFPPYTFNHVQEHMCLHVLVSEHVAYVVFPECTSFPKTNGREKCENARQERKKQKEKERTETNQACAWNEFLSFFFIHNYYTRFCSEIRASLESLNTSLAALGHTMSKGQGMWRDRYTICPFYLSPFCARRFFFFSCVRPRKTTAVYVCTGVLRFQVACDLFFFCEFWIAISFERKKILLAIPKTVVNNPIRNFFSRKCTRIPDIFVECVDKIRKIDVR